MEKLDTAYVAFDGADLEAFNAVEKIEVIESRENSGNGIF